MKKKELIINKLDNISENLVANTKENFEITILSESSLKKDWINKEEEKAWKNFNYVSSEIMEIIK